MVFTSFGPETCGTTLPRSSSSSTAYAAPASADIASRRDHHDSTRHDSPLKQADDAILIDTDGTDADGVVAKLLEVVRGGRIG